MATCKYCGKSGIFHRVTKNGMCPNCETFVAQDLKNRQRIYNESKNILEHTENPDIAFLHLKKVKDTLSALMLYEQKGIGIFTPPPSVLHKDIEEKLDTLIFESFERAYGALMLKTSTLKTTSAKINNLRKFVGIIDNYLPAMENHTPLLNLRETTLQSIKHYEEPNSNIKEIDYQEKPLPILNKQLLKNIDSDLPNPYLEFLSKFINGQTIEYFTQNEYWRNLWENALNESPKAAIKKLISRGFLQPSSLETKMDYSFKVVDLKQFSKERGLPVSGLKAELIKRLIKADEKGMNLKVAGLQLISCTKDGELLSRKYLDKKQEDRRIAENSVLNALKSRDFHSAVRTMISYEANQVIPRGLGIDWRNTEGKQFIDELKILFGKPPVILRDIQKENLNLLRMYAAIDCLWGTKTKVPDEIGKLSQRYSNETCVNQLISFAYNQKTLVDYKNSGVVKGVTILVAEDGCKECKKLSNRKFYFNSQIPELPNANCTNPGGCRCTYLAIMNV